MLVFIQINTHMKLIQHLSIPTYYGAIIVTRLVFNLVKQYKEHIFLHFFVAVSDVKCPREFLLALIL